MAKKQCTACGKNIGFLGGDLEYKGQFVCDKCYVNLKQSDIDKEERDILDKAKVVKLTTTHNIDGFKVLKYIDIESVEIVIGTGIFVEFTGGIQDVFGARSSGFEKKLADAKRAAMEILRICAVKKGGNAVIGIDLDYTEFSGNRVGLILNGTIVELTSVEP